jgi:cytochrome c oxidase assembly protein subunit 15
LFRFLETAATGKVAAVFVFLGHGFISPKRLKSNPWLHRFAVLTALATLGLVVVGGLVTSHGVGMAVPDWPTSYGYNMFALPISLWLTGGVFHEHTHRLWASFVGVLVVALTRWLGGRKACAPLLLIGLVELAAGWFLLRLGADWRGTGHFLSGIGGVVLLGGIVWTNNAPSAKPLPALGWLAFVLVQIQGLLGGLRVVLDAQIVADVRLGTAFGIVHGCLGQAFLVLLCVIALFTSRWWCERKNVQRTDAVAADPLMGRLFLFTTILVFLQLMIGATMRHQHAGLAIPDFPLAYGKLWPDMSSEAVARYNQQRLEITAANAITPFQIGLQMVHRLMALAIMAAVGALAWRAYRSPVATPSRRLAFSWVGLIFFQAGLGAWTIWSNKAADVATAHVLVGALSLVTGVMGCIIYFRRRAGRTESAFAPESEVLRREAPVSAGANP